MAGKRLDLMLAHLKPTLLLERSRRPDILSSTLCKHYSMTSSSNKVEVNGVNIHFERVGNGSHVVLLLPGALGCSQTDFRPQLEGLSREKYTLIAFDPRGYGGSRPPERDWPINFFDRDANDAAMLMQKLGFSCYSILGWSDGGITGLKIAGSFQENVKKLLIWGANAYITEKDLEMWKVIGDTSLWNKRMLGPFLAVYGEEYLKSHLKQWADAVRRIFKEKNGDVCIGSLPKVKCKTLIINGHKDALVPQEHPLYLHKHIAKCRKIDWPEGKHNLHLRYATEFNQAAEEFLDEDDES